MSKLVEVKQGEVGGLPLDELSTLTMTYNQDGYEELIADIAKNGQKVPILLRDGKILDGRHRHRACLDLDISVMCEELGPISYAEALDVVITNSISKHTESDAAKTEAYLMCKAGGIASNKMPSKFSRLNINYVRKLAFIEKCNPEYLNILLKQNSIRLYSLEFNKAENYGTIHGLWRCLKGNQKLVDKVVEVIPEPTSAKDFTVNLGEYFDNANAESEYWELHNIAKEAGSNLHPDSTLGKRVASLIKHKYT